MDIHLPLSMTLHYKMLMAQNFRHSQVAMWQERISGGLEEGLWCGF